MKRGKSKFWLDTWASSNHVEFYLRWETLIMRKDFRDIRTSNRQMIPTYCTNYAAILHDCMGVGIEVMPRTWALWYKSSIRRLCISLWIIYFWFDLPHVPIFKKTKPKLNK